ncbi:peptide ABC transporter substrate-binding protein [Herbaspirillum hiltneri N3]|uniref:Peptide ABC transporter substrate-binding protein n=1 Tax=Herbaspirillum hiltneri N3 TaxID=1262470 RepID=A0ABM5V4A1_9BURK|nr:extracellular solute-binding protein [Herbaspirillum hiltneri]AKZ64375.1 peptide ABC transporter substrate-binding protein [Herbaspirillum hiltneri N3]
MRKFTLSTLLLSFAATVGFSGPVFADHAFSLYDTPKYPAGFTHFDYVNPDAPKRGTLYLANPDRRTSFDKFNPFSLKGVAAAGVSTLMFETLAIGSSDEVATMYGLLADDMTLAPDRMAMTFHLNPKARFNNGDPVTAADVKYSYDTLLAKGAPQFKSMFADVRQCVVVDAQTVRFEFKTRNHELPLIVGGVPVFSRKWAAGTAFDNIQLTPPITSGPYLIDAYDVGRNITYKRNPAYWGTDIPVRKGSFNFERIAYRFYKDDVARLEAFKAGEFDVVVEYSAKNWVRNYNGPKFASGEIVKRELKHSNGAGMQGFVMNLRRNQFKDARVRQALGLALDYEWMNRQLFYGQYTRIYSFFNNSELAATGAPEGDELKLLESIRASGTKIDPTVFGPAPIPPNTNPPGSLRGNLLQARELLRQAGWEYRDGALRNAKGDVFAFEILDDQSALSRVISIYVRNLQKLGIQVTQRTADFALVAKRMDEFDYDMTSIRFPDVSSPGNEMFDMFGSKAADEKGSNNVWGLKDKAVDKLVEALVAANTRKDLVAAARGLDRVLLHKYIVVPQWYSSTHRVAYRNRFGIPAVAPLYYQADPYVISSWWEVSPK